MAGAPLRVLRAAQIPDPSAEAHPWLVEPLWSAGAVGMIGGAPKTGPGRRGRYRAPPPADPSVRD